MSTDLSMSLPQEIEKSLANIDRLLMKVGVITEQKQAQLDELEATYQNLDFDNIPNLVEETKIKIKALEAELLTLLSKAEKSFELDRAEK